MTDDDPVVFLAVTAAVGLLTVLAPVAAAAYLALQLHRRAVRAS